MTGRAFEFWVRKSQLLVGLFIASALAVGQTVQQLRTRPKQGFLTETLNLGGLPSGVYTVRIHAQEGMVVKRLGKE